MNEIVKMLTEMDAGGRRVELFNHKTSRKSERWSCVVGDINVTGFRRQHGNLNYFREYGETPERAVENAYNRWKNGGEPIINEDDGWGKD